jgi:plastocyanin
MSILGRHVPLRVVAVAALLLVMGALLPAVSLWPAGPTREITLVARGMAFHLENDVVTENPTIELKAGERVRIVLRNQDRGMTHDFAVPAFNAGLDAIEWREAGDVVLDVPTTPGTYEYVCRPHIAMMRGTLRVTP